MKFNAMMLGYSNSGKTWLLGSLSSLASQVYSEGITITRSDVLKGGTIDQIANEIKTSVVPTSMFGDVGFLKHNLALKRGTFQTLVEVVLTDVRGQAFDPGTKSFDDIAPKIYHELGNQDAAIICVKAPSNQDEKEVEIRKLRHLMHFLEGLFKTVQTPPPVAILITQIDSHPLVKGLDSRVDTHLQNSFAALYPNPASTIDRQRLRFWRENRGEWVSKELRRIVYDSTIDELIELSCRLTKFSDPPFANRVFLTSAVGFGPDPKANPKAPIRPFGIGVALLWTIYASIKAKGNRFVAATGVTAEALLKDIDSRLSEGDGYFEGQGGSTGPWSRKAYEEFFFHKRYLDTF